LSQTLKIEFLIKFLKYFNDSSPHHILARIGLVAVGVSVDDRTRVRSCLRRTRWTVNVCGTIVMKVYSHAVAKARPVECRPNRKCTGDKIRVLDTQHDVTNIACVIKEVHRSIKYYYANGCSFYSVNMPSMCMWTRAGTVCT
jgi:hypothetical protein